MTKAAVAIAGVMVMCEVAFGADADVEKAAAAKMPTRFFDVLPTFCEKIEAAGGEGEFKAVGEPGVRPQSDLAQFFYQLGVEWPVGSSITYAPSIGKLIVRNTPEEMAKIENLLPMLNVMPNQIEITAEFVSVPIDVVSAHLNVGERMDAERLRKLVSEAKAKLVSIATVVTQSGSEAVVKGVTEYIYPTEYTVCPAASTNEEGELDARGLPVVEPSGFETREVGTIFQVMPEITPDGQMVQLTFAPQIVGDPAWQDYGMEVKLGKGGGMRLPMKEPIFETHTVQTSVSMYAGASLVVGGVLDSKEPLKVVYTMLTVHRIGADGKTLKRMTSLEPGAAGGE